MPNRYSHLNQLTCLILGIGIFIRLAGANEMIKVQFVQRPPYTFEGPAGTAEGLLPALVEPIFKRAGIELVWERTSLNRQWDALQNPNEMTCSIGWYRTPEREQLAKFTKPIYQDQAVVLLARKQVPFTPNDSLEKLLEVKGLRILVKDKYSYGPRLDRLIANHKSGVIVSDAENQRMARLLSADRADVMFAAKEEAEFLLENSDPGAELQILNPNNMPTGEKRYIACNRLVSDELIQRINQAINLK